MRCHVVRPYRRVGKADPFRRSEPALCLPARVMGRRAILRSDPGDGHAADGRRLQRLLLDPARAAERTGRGAGGPARAEGDDAGELASFRDAPLGAGPESTLTMVVMDSGLALARPGMTSSMRGGALAHASYWPGILTTLISIAEK
jgi:hypothetical protein